jgi:hypothetical protein
MNRNSSSYRFSMISSDGREGLSSATQAPLPEGNRLAAQRSALMSGVLEWKTGLENVSWETRLAAEAS